VVGGVSVVVMGYGGPQQRRCFHLRASDRGLQGVRAKRNMLGRLAQGPGRRNQCNRPLASPATRVEVVGRKARVRMAASAMKSSRVDAGLVLVGTQSFMV